MLNLENHEELRLSFQPAIVKKSNFLMVTLMKNKSP